jgi:precorrin-6Y C5,15-methyltransferase (decarboxylating)
VTTATAENWGEDLQASIDPLNVVAVECVADVGAPLLPTAPGLPDDAFEHDGQLTKREVRAVTLARLAPVPGQRLWDVGAGAGSVAIEWCRAHPACRAVAVEHDPARAARIGRNAAALGVPRLQIVVGAAPQALDDLDAPDAVFVGGGTTVPGVLDACWTALRPGGRLVVNAITVESEAVVLRWHAELGGDLARLAVDRAAPVGGFTGWRPLMPVTQWAVTKP